MTDCFTTHVMVTYFVSLLSLSQMQGGASLPTCHPLLPHTPFLMYIPLGILTLGLWPATLLGALGELTSQKVSLKGQCQRGSLIECLIKANGAELTCGCRTFGLVGHHVATLPVFTLHLCNFFCMCLHFLCISIVPRPLSRLHFYIMTQSGLRMLSP